MKSAALVCLAALAATPALAQPSQAVDLYNAAARMVVIPEARRDVDIRIAPGDPRLPPLQPRPERGEIRVDGGLANRIHECGAYRGPMPGGDRPRETSVRIDGIGWVARSALPVVTVRVPLDAKVGASGAVWGDVAPSGSLTLAHGGCGDWTVAPVRGLFTLAVTGSGDTRARTAGALQSATNGSGDLQMDAVAGKVDIAIRGSGDVKIGRVDGPITTATAGSGDIHIDGGRVPSVTSHIAGSGDMIFDGEAGALTAAVNGSGDVHVAHVSGPVTKAVHGSGDITAGR